MIARSGCRVCGKPPVARGLCRTCHQRWNRRRWAGKERDCAKCGAPFVCSSTQYTYCDPCERDRKRTRKLRRKTALDTYKLERGCERCGEQSNTPELLEFHHRDPDDKSFTIGKHKNNVSEEQLWAEVEKCDVLCVDCHAAVDPFRAEGYAA